MINRSRRRKEKNKTKLKWIQKVAEYDVDLVLANYGPQAKSSPP